ncbi:acetylornithine/succinylornithine aminotransferase [Desulfocapsa sulfexigens DSM 10523]|uniref:Acetylornithine aminotransferase n=1 Tax=Desulfocapsa sulfexigens (strain DSM 10523 / SB164P1) TaxID=1167006 RepID=M1NBS8_DESSD|nr:aspartate aminotransferase family protein [Desulfocapsa sulfexigens]AGF77264.1 acetylornithine/succinylornithine aminotransferase [Desulfocapsa sulfexigens DSM 10523]
MSGENAGWAKRSDDVIIGTYTRYPATMVKGEGCILTDAEGKEYLDCLAGIAVCSLGHCHPVVTEAICAQARQLVHVSNLYYTQPQTELAELLTENSFADRVFLANSGAEANEAAIKLARICAGYERYGIISLAGSFHGRTLATVAATGQPKFQEGFEPMPEGFSHAPFGNLNVLEAMITDQTCAIMCEPLQGEGGVRPLDVEYLKGLQDLCRKHDLLLIFDEIQTGMGRTGSLFAYEQLGIVPDIMTVAKALGNGLPIGAMLTRKEIAASLAPGTHGTTFGGNPVVAAGAVATLKIMLEEGFLAEVREKGDYLQKGLEDLAGRFPLLASGARGMGLIRGLVLTEKGIEQGGAIVKALFERGVLINFAGNKALRFLPPLIITRTELDQLLTALGEVLGECKV